MRTALAVTVALLSQTAAAFCGFYVSGADTKLFNDTSMVVLLRDGTKTVLSMQNNYRGPVEDFALVVPVPVLLGKDSVKTIPREVFARVDEFAAPRLVELPPPDCGFGGLGLRGTGVGGGGYGAGLGSLGGRDLGVKVEAKFDVEEYEIVILSAKDSLGLEIWLKEYKYKVPEGAAELLRPYVQNGQKFFVARVNAAKAKFENGQLLLSPLRFHYDSEQFSLPVRLGLVNSGGTQDLVVHVLAKDRYELANMKNVLVPTNVELTERARPQFGGFYKELLSRTFAKNPGAAVTEYAWKGALPSPDSVAGVYGVTCDPCPPVNPVDQPLARYLGVDLLPKRKTDAEVSTFMREATLTRLHLRYTKAGAPDDLVFKTATPIHGGVPDVAKAGPAKSNRFQGRFIMRLKSCSNMGNMFGAPPVPWETDEKLAPATLVDPFEEVLTTAIAELGAQPKALSAKRALPRVPPPPPVPSAPSLSARNPVTVDEPIVGGEGVLDADLVKAIINRNRGQLRYCYEAQLNRNPSLAGKLTLGFIIQPDGTVNGASVSENTVGSDEVRNCVASRPARWAFPKPKKGKPVTVKVTLTFSQGQ